jgi:hypothetical protein
MRHVPAAVVRNNRGNIDGSRRPFALPPELAVERPMVADSVVLPAGRDPARSRSDRERCEPRAAPIVPAGVKLADVTVVGRKKLVEVPAGIPYVLERQKRRSREKEVVASLGLSFRDCVEQVARPLGQIVALAVGLLPVLGIRCERAFVTRVRHRQRRRSRRLRGGGARCGGRARRKMAGWRAVLLATQRGNGERQHACQVAPRNRMHAAQSTRSVVYTRAKR